MPEVTRSMPWIAIPVIIAIVQLVRDAPLDAIVWGAVALLLALDVVGILPEAPALRAPPAPLLAAGLVVAVALVASPRHGPLGRRRRRPLPPGAELLPPRPR